ncbi:MAG: hypothetical protein ACYCO3_00350 [Mycobacteriales bacterium]
MRADLCSTDAGVDVVFVRTWQPVADPPAPGPTGELPSPGNPDPERLLGAPRVNAWRVAQETVADRLPLLAAR